MYNAKRNFNEATPRRRLLDPTPLDSGAPNVELKLQIPYSVRKRHIYIIGKTQHGKSTLLESIISQDIKNDMGVCVLDPKPSGEKPNLVESILQHIPKEREKDVIYFHAAKPLPLDVMSWENENEDERQTLADDLYKTFMNFGDQNDSGSRWPGILLYVIHTILEAKGCTFLDIYHFLSDPNLREKKGTVETSRAMQILKRIPHRPDLLEYWHQVYPLYEKTAPTPILNRMSQHMLVPPLNTMLGAYKAQLSIDDVIRDRKILLVNLTGAGSQTADFIGTLFVTRIQQAVFRGKKKPPFHFFADEFQNFQTASFNKILAESASLGLRLTLANQYVDQIDPKIRKAIFGNVGTYIIFNIGDDDTGYFKNMVPPDFDYRLLANPLQMPPYRAAYAIAGQAPVIKNIPRPSRPPTQEQLDRAEDIKIRTLKYYGCPEPDPPLKSSLSAKPDTPEAQGEPSEGQVPQPTNIPDDTREAERPGITREPLHPQDK